MLAQVSEAAQLAQEFAKSAVGRSDTIWLAGVIVLGLFGLAGLVIYFVVIPWSKSQIDLNNKRAEADERRAEADDKRAEELNGAVKALCDVSGKSHTLAVSTEQVVDRIERQLFHILMWKKAATKAVEVLCEGKDANPNLAAALGAMRGSLSLVDVDSGHIAPLPMSAKGGRQ